MDFLCSLFQAHDTLIVELRQLLHFVSLALELRYPVAEVQRCVIIALRPLLSIVLVFRVSVIRGMILIHAGSILVAILRY